MRKLSVLLSGLLLTPFLAYGQSSTSPEGESKDSHIPIEKITESPYVQCQVFMQRANPALAKITDWKKIELTRSVNSAAIDRFGRAQFKFAATENGNTIETAEYVVDLSVELHKNSNWVRTNGVGRNLRIYAKASRKMNGVKQPIAAAIENTDQIRNITYLSRASANDYVYPAFFFAVPDIYDYFDPESPKSLLGDQDLELAYIDSGVAKAIDDAFAKGRIPGKTVYGFTVACEARFRNEPLPTSEYIIRGSSGGAVCQGLVDRSGSFEGLDGLNILKQMTGAK